MAYLLYKQPVQPETLCIVQYLNSIGSGMLPRICIERNHPPWAKALPSIADERGDVHVGLDACVAYYERRSGVVGLLAKSRAFKDARPDYRVRSGVPSPSPA